MIYRQVIQESPLQGTNWFNGLQHAIYSLQDLPERCPAAPKLSTEADIVRRLLYGHPPHVYKVYYHLITNTVEIMHIRHGARREPRRRDVK
jgi:plasmid stabilization system protein ParE